MGLSFISHKRDVVVFFMKYLIPNFYMINLYYLYTLNKEGIKELDGKVIELQKHNIAQEIRNNEEDNLEEINDLEERDIRSSNEIL